MLCCGPRRALIKLLNDFYVMLSANGLYFVILLGITSLNTSPLQTLVLIETHQARAPALRWQNHFKDLQNFLSFASSSAISAMKVVPSAFEAGLILYQALSRLIR